MAKAKTKIKTSNPGLEKAPTGIKGLDEIIHGGLPKGRVSLVCGGPGCGKTLFATEFLVRGAQEFGEPGVFMAFEETAEELAKNVASLGIDLDDLIQREKILVDYVFIERSEIQETGVYDLEGLFVRLADAIDTIGAKRVVLDTIETLFSGFSDDNILRAELRRLFRWLKARGVTAVVTGERGEGTLTRYGLEEYVSDCVILLDNRIRNQISTRRLRVVKYRGSEHGSDEYPFLIDSGGIWVQPISSSGLDYEVTSEFMPTGIPRLDTMLDGKGYFRGSTILVSGTAGTGKTSIAACLVDAACRRGERCLYFAFEESPGQIMRNMRSIGLDLGKWVAGKGLLQFHAARPSMYGVESHLLSMQRAIDEFEPRVAVIDPITNLISIATDLEVKSMLVRLIDYLKRRQVTALFTNLVSGGDPEAATQVDISSLMDTWLLVRNIENNGERNRGLYILKSRGMPHSSQVREFRLSDSGVDLIDVYVAEDGVLTGTARLAREARQKAEELLRQQEIEIKQRSLERRRAALGSQIAALQAEFASEEEELQRLAAQEDLRRQAQLKNREEIALSRQADPSSNPGNGSEIRPEG
jgi:circadian clock protein KaiC